MKTLHITNAYHPTSGGIRTFYNALLEAGNAAGRHVRLIVPGARTEVEERGPFGRVYYVQAPPAPAFDRRYRLILPQTFLPWSRSLIVEILERERPDLIEFNDKYSLPYLAAMLRKRWHPRVPRPPQLRAFRRQHGRLPHQQLPRSHLHTVVHPAHLRTTI